MEDFMRAMNKLKSAILYLDVWTIIVTLILAGLIGTNFVLPTLLGEPLYYSIIYALLYLILLPVIFLINRLIKDIQKAITFVLLRAFVYFILPIPLIFLAVSLIVKALIAVIFIVSFITFILVFLPINKLLKIQKQMASQ